MVDRPMGLKSPSSQYFLRGINWTPPTPGKLSCRAAMADGHLFNNILLGGRGGTVTIHIPPFPPSLLPILLLPRFFLVFLDLFGRFWWSRSLGLFFFFFSGCCSDSVVVVVVDGRIRASSGCTRAGSCGRSKGAGGRWRLPRTTSSASPGCGCPRRSSSASSSRTASSTSSPDSASR